MIVISLCCVTSSNCTSSVINQSACPFWSNGLPHNSIQNFNESFDSSVVFFVLFLFPIGIHSMQGRTATTRHESTKRSRHTGNLFIKKLQLNSQKMSVNSRPKAI